MHEKNARSALLSSKAVENTASGFRFAKFSQFSLNLDTLSAFLGELLYFMMFYITA
jgi:hypothetical protein